MLTRLKAARHASLVKPANSTGQHIAENWLASSPVKYISCRTAHQRLLQNNYRRTVADVTDEYKETGQKVTSRLRNPRGSAETTTPAVSSKATAYRTNAAQRRCSAAVPKRAAYSLGRLRSRAAPASARCHAMEQRAAADTPAKSLPAQPSQP